MATRGRQSVGEVARGRAGQARDCGGAPPPRTNGPNGDPPPPPPVPPNWLSRPAAAGRKTVAHRRRNPRPERRTNALKDRTGRRLLGKGS